MRRRLIGPFAERRRKGYCRDDADFLCVCGSTAVTALLGTMPVRLYPFGMQDDKVTYPYAVWQNVSGSPENYLGTRPDIDSFTLQVDVYADTAAQAVTVAKVMRDAIEPHAYITRWGIRSEIQKRSGTATPSMLIG